MTRWPPSARLLRLALSLLASGTLLTACDRSNRPGALATCPPSATPIHAIQGTDWNSPMVGQTHSVNGVLTMRTADGLYIESLQPDRDPDTSEGLFLATSSSAPDLVPGTVISARGTVAELGERRDTQTALTDLTALDSCGDPAARPQTAASLPLGGRDREALESMRISLDSASIVTDVYRLHDGVFQIAKDFYLPQPTEVARPGREAAQQASRNRAYSLYVGLPADERPVFAIGDELLSDSGVLGHDGIGPRLLLEAAPRLIAEPPPRMAPPARGNLRVLSLNLENYFNGDGRGGAFPTPRGAETPSEFAAQRDRFRAAIELLEPHILAVQELENDGFERYSAAADFLEDLEAATGERWSVARPREATIGTDQITVGIFYRPDLVSAQGPAQLLDAAPFDLLNRKPLTQVFEHPASGQRFAVNVNHFKSKGGCPDQGRDQNQDDGQACWNAARTAAARALSPWLEQLAQDEAQGRALLLGDLNAYRMEDPVQHFIAEGFVDLTATFGERHRYSFLFRGLTGTLDHALATSAMANDVAQSRILNINAAYPRRMTLPEPWLRSSDHDPVIVDLRFTQPSTSN